MASLKYWVWLSAQTELGAMGRARLIERFGDPETLFYAKPEELRRLNGVSERMIAQLTARDLGCVEPILSAARAQGLQIITQQDSQYPRRLKEILAPPVCLYVLGTLPLLDEEAVIAVVGTREATDYGRSAARRLACELTDCGALVLSCLTQGIDEAAAVGAFTAGRCLGLLATPHERSNRDYNDLFIKNGALISEHPPGARTFRSTFAERNRLTAGLSLGVVVVEAPEKSGALNIAREAAALGREVFAVPGSVDSRSSVGSNALLRGDARPAAVAWDVLEDLAPRFPGKLTKREPRPHEPWPELKRTGPVLTEKPRKTWHAESAESVRNEKKAVDKPAPTVYSETSELPDWVNEEQRSIYAAISQPSTHIDDIIGKTGLSSSCVLGHITIMQIRGLITGERGHTFSRKLQEK